MTELQEPITLVEPICGLGEDYEPEVVWTAYTPIVGLPLPPRYGICFESEEASRANGGPRNKYTIPEACELARKTGHVGIGVLDINCRVVASWPL